MYAWYVKTLKEIHGNFSDDTIFVTDKCATLINQLDDYFPDNHKLLCTWHMIQNWSKHATLKVFKTSSIVNDFKNNVFAMINCSASESYFTLENKIEAIFSNSSNFVSNEAHTAFIKYYDEWEKYIERWAGHITS